VNSEPISIESAMLKYVLAEVNYYMTRHNMNAVAAVAMLPPQHQEYAMRRLFYDHV
jgi:hypothetical protein